MRALLLTLTTCLFVLPAHAKYSGGTGEPNDPYQIATAADLIALGETPADYDKHFLLTADIDLDPNLPGRKVFDKAVIAPAAPINTYPFVQGTPFTGALDGNGHTISHLTITGGSYIALFGQLEGEGEVRRLEVRDINVTGVYYVGGLVGSNWGSVTQCYSTGAVSGCDRVGGLVGLNAGGVHRCFSAGAVSCTGRFTNDLQCFGGLVGHNSWEGTLTNCYSTGPVMGWGSHGGGLVGWNDGTVSQCYSTGSVQYAVSGGLVGRGGGGAVVQCFWDTQTSGRVTSVGGLGKTTAEMQDVRTYLDAGWDFVGEAENGTAEVWQMPQGGGYPVLAILSGYTPPQLQGQGAPDDPYLISDARELGAMIYYSPRASYRLVTSVDLSGIRWVTPVIPWFAGTFDGDSLTISHLTIQGGGYLGLFGQLTPGTEVKNLGVVDVNVAGSGDHVGSLAGSSDGTVVQCYSTGAVSGDYWVGGLVGGNGGDVTRCYSTGAVSGAGDYVGGLVGSNSGHLSQCYSTGAVRGDMSVGGLVGDNGGTVFDCYSTGTVSGYARVGGLVGENYSGIASCHSSSTVSGDSDVGGLVGWNNGTIADCYAEGSVTGDSRVGGLAGTNGLCGGYPLGPECSDGVISNCYSISAVTGTASVGGLVGMNASGPVTQCYSTSTVTGDESTGGLMGENSLCGSATHCYAAGVVSGNERVGGLVGSNSYLGGIYLGGIVTDCYSTSSVSGSALVGGLVGDGVGSHVTDCFWDTETSGQTTSAGGTGKTTAEMQTAKTFLDAGWDFVGEAANGTEDIWWILEGKDYPRLWWEAGDEASK